MNVSEHAEKRLNQRGIKMNDVHLILLYGEWIGDDIVYISSKAKFFAIKSCKKLIKALEEDRPEGWMDEKSRLWKVIQRFDKLVDKTVVVDSVSMTFEIITGYGRYSKQGKRLRRYGRKMGDWC